MLTLLGIFIGRRMFTKDISLEYINNIMMLLTLLLTAIYSIRLIKNTIRIIEISKYVSLALIVGILPVLLLSCLGLTTGLFLIYYLIQLRSTASLYIGLVLILLLTSVYRAHSNLIFFWDSIMAAVSTFMVNRFSSFEYAPIVSVKYVSYHIIRFVIYLFINTNIVILLLLSILILILI